MSVPEKVMNAEFQACFFKTESVGLVMSETAFSANSCVAGKKEHNRNSGGPMFCSSEEPLLLLPLEGNSCYS